MSAHRDMTGPMAGCVIVFIWLFAIAWLGFLGWLAYLLVMHFTHGGAS